MAEPNVRRRARTVWNVLILSMYGTTFIVMVLYLSGGLGGLRWWEPRQPPVATHPGPGLTPADVVRAQLHALRQNDAQDSGIAVCFRFASPDNQRMTGPVERFARMIKEGPYAVMLRYIDAEFGPVEIEERRAWQLVRLVDEDGQSQVFTFHLSRQTIGEYAGCWMTDAVQPAPVPPSGGPEERPGPLVL